MRVDAKDAALHGEEPLVGLGVVEVEVPVPHEGDGVVFGAQRGHLGEVIGHVEAVVDEGGAGRGFGDVGASLAAFGWGRVRSVCWPRRSGGGAGMGVLCEGGTYEFRLANHHSHALPAPTSFQPGSNSSRPIRSRFCR